MKDTHPFHDSNCLWGEAYDMLGSEQRDFNFTMFYFFSFKNWEKNVKICYTSQF